MKAISPLTTLCKLVAFFALIPAGCNNPESNVQDKTVLCNDGNHALVLNKGVNKGAEVDQKIELVKSGLYHKNLLEVISELDHISGKGGYETGRGLIIQDLLGKRLTKEVFPVLANKVFKEGPDEVFVADFTKPGVFDASTDFARGLRLIVRRKVNNLQISTLLFLDYNAKTNKLEFPQDFFLNEEKRVIPDAMRALIQYDVYPSNDVIQHFAKIDSNYNTEAGFFGATMAAEVNSNSQVVNFHIRPTRDPFGEGLVDKSGSDIGGMVSFHGCIGCHEKENRGFASSSFSGYHELQSNVHRRENQDVAIADFFSYIRERDNFVPGDKREVNLSILKGHLEDPKKNLHRLLPAGFLQALDRSLDKTSPSTVLERYNQPLISINSKK